MIKVQDKKASIYPEIVKPEAWIANRPRRASLETQLWLGALAFLEAVLNFDNVSRYSFLEILRQWGTRGCQQIVNDVRSDRFSSYDYAEKFLSAKQTQGTLPTLASCSAKFQKYEADIKSGKFKNDDYIKLVSLVSEFAKAHCNRQSDYENSTYKITIEKSPRLFSVLIFKSLCIYMRKNPESIDEKRFGRLFHVVYSNPKGNQDKNLKSHFIQHWERLEWQLHNDSYYSRKAELCYQVMVSPGRLYQVVDEISRRDKRNPVTVKRQIQSTISLIKAAVMLDIGDDIE